MDRPLWQILLSLFIVGLALQRGAAGAILHLSGVGPGVLALYGLQVALALATALGLWLGKLWTVGALLALAGAMVLTAGIETFALGVRPPMAALGQAMVVALSAAGLGYVLHRELSVGPRSVDEERRAARRPG